MHRVHASVFAGIALGSLATVALPIAASYAQAQPPPAGAWDCFVVDRLPDLYAARSWGPASDITNGLNRIAPDVTKGTVIAVNPKGGPSASVTCVKH
jgi:hypothetical protein